MKGLAWTTGDAEDLPFPDASFDGYTIAFGLRNVTDIDAALARGPSRAEARRPLRLPRVQPRDARGRSARLYEAYSERALPLLGRVIARDAESYRYLHESIRRFPPQPELADRMKQAGFANVGWRDMTLGVVALHTGWRI